MKITFGEYIRQLRAEKEMTLTQLATKLDMDLANLSKIENNKRDFNQKRLPLLAEIFGIDIDILQNEYITDQIGKKIYELNCTKQLLKIAEEKAEYRRKIKTNTL